MKVKLFFLVTLAALCFNREEVFAQAKYPIPVEGDYVINDFVFSHGEKLAALKLHYRMIGQPKSDKAGNVLNAVLLMHATTGNGTSFLNERFAGNLFAPGQLLDATKYCIIIPDAVGHGKSSKPSDELHMRFPVYNYDDMVLANYRLLTEHLHINHLRLVMGTSMGGMQTWVWAYQYPNYMDALLPLASLPVMVAGRNRIQRKMAIDLIKMDPAWKNGEYAQQPKVGLTGAISSLIFMSTSPLQLQKSSPTRESAEAMLESLEKRYFNSLDANDFIYQFDASQDYNPAPHLGKIVAPLFAINSADDQVNPPELGILDKEIKNVKRGRYILLPITDQTNGHGTHSIPAIWGSYLEELLKVSEPAK